MKTIGMIGGMSWESSLAYYRLVNQGVKERLGGFHSAACVMVSVDFHEVEQYQARGDWAAAARLMTAAAQKVEKAGADFLIICTNTMHKVAREVLAHIRIPLLHIADPTAQSVISHDIQTVGLLGTRFTMEEDFYKGKLVQDYGLTVVTPTDDEMNVIHRVIFQELCLGKIEADSRRRYLEIVDSLIRRGAQGVILGCTEIGLLIKNGDSRVPFFDTTRIHAEAAVAMALS